MEVCSEVCKWDVEQKGKSAYETLEKGKAFVRSNAWMLERRRYDDEDEATCGDRLSEWKLSGPFEQGGMVKMIYCLVRDAMYMRTFCHNHDAQNMYNISF